MDLLHDFPGLHKKIHAYDKNIETETISMDDWETFEKVREKTNEKAGIIISNSYGRIIYINNEAMKILKFKDFRDILDKEVAELFLSIELIPLPTRWENDLFRKHNIFLLAHDNISESVFAVSSLVMKNTRGHAFGWIISLLDMNSLY